MSLDELLEVIQMSKFQSVLNKFGFEQIYKKYEVKDGYHDQCLIGFESKNCKLGIYYQPGSGIHSFLGLKSNDFDVDTEKWIGVNYVIAYILKKPIKRGGKRENNNYKEQLTEDLNETAKDFEILGSQILEMFQGEETINQWKPELEEYIKKDTQRKYGLK